MPKLQSSIDGQPNIIPLKLAKTVNFVLKKLYDDKDNMMLVHYKDVRLFHNGLELVRVEPAPSSNAATRSVCIDVLVFHRACEERRSNNNNRDFYGVLAGLVVGAALIYWYKR
jgi:hypothetical protein